MMRPLGLTLLLLLASPSTAGAPDSVESMLRSPHVERRLTAVDRLGERDDAGDEELLLEALKDRDWEVVERACRSLARRGTDQSTRPLAELALSAPARSVRLAAATALGKCAPENGARMLLPAVRSKDEVVAAKAAEALAEVRHDSTRDVLLAALGTAGAKTGELRRQAAAALGSLGDPSVIPELEKLFDDPDVGARCGALEGMARLRNFGIVPAILTLLQKPELSDLVERRAVHTLRRTFWTQRFNSEAPRALRKVIGAYRNEKDATVSARLARALSSLGRALPPAPAPAPGEEEPAGTDPADTPPADRPPEQPAATPPESAAAEPSGSPSALEGTGPIGNPADYVEALVSVSIDHEGMIARRAAAAALSRVGGDAALERLRTMVIEDKEASVRFHALRGVARWRDASDDVTFALLAKALRNDKSKHVREEAAVHMGVRGLKGAADTLVAALADDQWEVVTAAAISLGKTRDPRGIAPLKALFEAKDWRHRGAGAAGLGWTNLKEAIPPLIEALDDKEICVQRTAWEFLKRITDLDMPLKRKDWDDWWAENGERFEIVDREQELRDARRYGYALSDRDVYENLDVVVLASRGDSIEKLLEVLEIEHRMTRSKGLRKDGVQPFGVFVANCTGEIQKEDHERVQWFVHAGGALFASCWAIDKTIAVEFPATIRKFQKARGQVLDQVRAEEQATESEYLSGVFPGSTQPIYQLYGAFLVEVLDPERCEVLIDSPDCATRWNGGNLAAWFTAGHGVVMGSSNHFDRQTMSKLQNAKGVSIKTADDRKAFALNHFGFTWEKVRELEERGVFSKQALAEKEVTDLSAFRFLTNFVRRKRIGDL